MGLTVWCFGTAAPASVLLHGSHYSLTVGGIAGVAWIIAPGSWIDRVRSTIGGPEARHGDFLFSLVVTASAAAALVHLLVVPGHLRAEAGPWLAPAFLAVACLQAAWAYAVARRARAPHEGRLLLTLGAALQTGAIAAWLVSRTIGLPSAIYPGPTPAVGVPDLFAVLCQAIAVVAAVALMRTPAPAEPASPPLTRWAAWPPASRLTAAAAGSGLVALVAAGGLV